MALEKSGKKSQSKTIVEAIDVLIKIYKTTICGTELHIFKGDVPEVTDGRILGHEGNGVTEEVGMAMSHWVVTEYGIVNLFNKNLKTKNPGN